MTSVTINRVDGLSSSTAIKGPVFVATSTNIVLSGLQTIDGEALSVDDRVLVRSQTDARENGIYVVDTGPWRRASDFASNRDIRRGTQINVTDGTIYAASGWFVSNANPITIGTTEVEFTQNILLNAAHLIELEESAAQSADAAEAWAQSPNPVPPEFGGDGVSDRSAKWWAEQASAITIPDGSLTPDKLADVDALGYRMAANIRGRVNFFDFLQETRSSAVREQIMNGTFTGDLAVEWQAFRDALQAISTAGGRPYGFIPECKIYSSVAPNFAMDFLCLDTQGLVDIVGLGSARGFNVDGMGLGAGNYGVRDMRVGPLRASSEAGSRGAYIRRAHWSEFNGLASLGATFAAITVDGCVSTNFSKPLVSNQKEPFIVEPSIGLLVTGTAYDGGGDPEDWKNLIQTSWSKFDLPIIEWMPIGIILEHTYGNSIAGGTAEGCSDIGIQVSEFALYNKVFGTDFEVNTNYDMDIQGSFNEFYGVDCQAIAHFRFATSRGNKIFGGHFGEIRMDSGASRNLVTGANVNTITDTSTGATRNRFHNIADNVGGWSDKWTSWTPVVTSLLGTLTSYTAEGFYRIIDGDTVEVTLEISITSNGTGAGAVVATLPFAAAVGTILSGAEVGISAKSIHGNIPSGFSEVTIRAADGTYPGANGAALRLQGVYRRI